MFIPILLIALGFVLLIKGADYLVDGASSIAKKFHIPEIIIGLTIISIGTSMPELFVSITSAIDEFPDMAMGNVIGSNIANLFLILGLSALVKPIPFKKETRLIEIPICFFVSVVFFAICFIGQDVSRIDAGILITLFIAFIIYTIIMAKKGEEFDKEDKTEDAKEEETNKGKWSTLKDICFIILGVAALKFGGDFVVDNAVKVATILGLSEKIISVTILAIGTSLPELVTSVSAAAKGKSDIAVGNILGSNIFNMLLIIGTSALISPIVYNISYNKDLIILLAGTLVLALFPVIPPKNEMSRTNGIIYVLMYAGYMASLFFI